MKDKIEQGGDLHDEHAIIRTKLKRMVDQVNREVDEFEMTMIDTEKGAEIRFERKISEATGIAETIG